MTNTPPPKFTKAEETFLAFLDLPNAKIAAAIVVFCILYSIDYVLRDKGDWVKLWIRLTPMILLSAYFSALGTAKSIIRKLQGPAHSGNTNVQSH